MINRCAIIVIGNTYMKLFISHITTPHMGKHTHYTWANIHTTHGQTHTLHMGKHTHYTWANIHGVVSPVAWPNYCPPHHQRTGSVSSCTTSVSYCSWQPVEGVVY